MRNTDSDLGKTHLETTKGTLIKNLKTPPCLVGKDYNPGDPINSNHLYNLSERTQRNNGMHANKTQEDMKAKIRANLNVNARTKNETKNSLEELTSKGS